MLRTFGEGRSSAGVNGTDLHGQRIAQLAAEFLPPVRILHPWPSERFAVKYPKWEPGA